ncbi:MAG: ABC-F family ATP-binding cassette domain-containing protein [Syntrophales bacterium]
MIIIKNLSLSFGDRRIFDNVSWTIPENGRFGIVGDNGTGKTTLFRAILGLVEIDQGTIEIPSRYRSAIGYLPQDLAELKPIPLIDFLKHARGLDEIEQTLADCERQFSIHSSAVKTYEDALSRFQVLDGYAFEARARQVLKGLGFNECDADRNCSEFSGGWKMRIMLASILLSDPEIMLLDEPTNHLDTESMEWLESWLKDYSGTLLTVSHDRMFLNKLVRQIVEIQKNRFDFYKGNYSSYMKEKSHRSEELERKAARTQDRIGQTREFIERFRYKATKARQVQSRIRLLEHIDIPEISSSSRTVVIRFPEVPKSGKEVLSARNLTHCYGEETIFRNLNFSITRGEKIALVGMNGAGKSTLTRLISREEQPTGGKIHYGLEVKMGFFSQETARNLEYDRTIWEEILHCGGSLDDRERRNLLGAFLFSGDEIFKTISVLSGGEKSRLSLLKLLLDASNLLILDEPTNHLDIRTKEIFQNALLHYRGTVVIVSHDRDFLDRLVGRVIELHAGMIQDYPGNYSYFIEKRREQTFSTIDILKTQAVSEGTSKIPVRDLKEIRRIEAEERNRIYRIRSSLKKELAEIESAIGTMEQKKKENELTLCQVETYRNPALIRQLQKELKDIENLLERRYSQWDDLARWLDSLNNAEDVVI